MAEVVTEIRATGRSGGRDNCPLESCACRVRSPGKQGREDLRVSRELCDLIGRERTTHATQGGDGRLDLLLGKRHACPVARRSQKLDLREPLLECHCCQHGPDRWRGDLHP